MVTGQETEVQQGNKAFVRRRFPEATKDLGLEGKVKLGENYASDLNDRSKTSGSEILFNENWLDRINQQECERDLYHELQHVRNRTVERDHPEFAVMRKFILSPEFKGLYQRMKQFYQKHKRQGYSFFKVVPEELDPDQQAVGRTYTESEELLALLRGYERFLKQREANPAITPQPYEFTEAFRPEDLKFLVMHH